MGLLSSGSPLEWREVKQCAEHIHRNGVEQLINTYNRVKGRTYDCLKWGDEVEYVLVEMDEQTASCKVSLRAEEVLDSLKAEMKSKQDQFTATWHPEYGRYMLEGTPAAPYLHDLKDLLCVEKNMILRRRQAEALLKPNERLMAIGNFPRLGCPDAFVSSSSVKRLTNHASHSIFFPDEYINTHVRFKAATRNIRERKGEKVFINLPIFKDELTAKSFPPDRATALFPEALQETPNYRNDMIHLDAMGFGMGCCCLQITFQTRDISDARRLYDQLAVLCPIMLALTASTPIYRGILSDVDCRWKIISATVDDRTEEERSTGRIPKSRYASISRFISQDPRLKSEYNDLDLPYNECCFEALVKAGFDELLARHFAWLFVRDPLVIYRELLEQDNDASLDHFENIQSTNWQTMRFKPPPPEDPSTGWRVELRPMEVQFTDFENAACAVFVVLLARAILFYDLNFYMPISMVDKNMEIAERRDAVLLEKFSWRTSLKDGISELTLGEIMNGSPTQGHVGLISMIEKYLDSLNIDYDTRRQLNEYLSFIRMRSTGELMTPARWTRNFVQRHPNYKRDSLVSPRIAFDLIEQIDLLTHLLLVESSLSEDEKKVDQLFKIIREHQSSVSKGPSTIRLGFTGAPGVGKSSLIETFGLYLVEEQRKHLAVLTVDPSSIRSGGSILGDKTRMPSLSQHSGAYIRSSPNQGDAGGVTASTFDTIRLCECIQGYLAQILSVHVDSGFDVVIVETVGVGQSELAVADLVDIFILIVAPGIGDELQGLKKGITEVADMILVNKADHEQDQAANQAIFEYRSAMKFTMGGQPPKKVLPVSAKTGRGIKEAWETIQAFTLRDPKRISERRRQQEINWMALVAQHQLAKRFREYFNSQGASVSLSAGSLKTSANQILASYLSAKMSD